MFICQIWQTFRHKEKHLLQGYMISPGIQRAELQSDLRNRLKYWFWHRILFLCLHRHINTYSLLLLQASFLCLPVSIMEKRYYWPFSLPLLGTSAMLYWTCLVPTPDFWGKYWLAKCLSVARSWTNSGYCEINLIFYRLLNHMFEWSFLLKVVMIQERNGHKN